MKRILLISCLFLAIAGIHSDAFAQCFNAPNGLYPAGTFTPTCNGAFQTITTCGYCGEYSNVNVVTGTTYTFQSSVGTDYITISNAAGTVAYATGTGTVVWPATVTGVVRFYTHVSAACGSNTVCRTRRMSCNVPCGLNTVTVNMFDTFGDGWNGATFTLYDAALTVVGSGTLATGTTGTATFCLPTGCYTITVSLGSWPGEVSWNVTVNGGSPISAGGAGATSFVVPVNTACPNSITCNNLVPFSGNNTITACSGTICDHAGMSNYNINANGYTVINPSTPGYLVQVNGYLNSEFGYDYVEFYDGVGLGTFIIGYWGTGTLPAPVTSTTGSLTVRYVSDFSNNLSGFSFNITCINPLPIELLSFTGSCDDATGNRKLVWVTASEINNDHFTIERSFDAINWTEVHREPGAGNSNTELSYHWTDAEMLDKIVYYRLSQTDFNGDFETFDLISMNCQVDGTNPIVAPNPNDGTFNLRFADAEGKEVLLVLMDLSGKTILQRTVTATGSAQIVPFNETLAPGLYCLTVYGSMTKTVRVCVGK